jgi:hypothetical protein
MASTIELQNNPEVLKKTTSTSETGHAKNVANFGKLVSFCTGYGAAYNPVRSTLSLNALFKMQNESQSTVYAVNVVLPAYNNAVAAREGAFKPVNKLITRVMNALKAADTTPETDAKVASLVRKLQGRRVSAKLTEEEKKALAEQGKEQIEISASQLSFDNRLDTLDKLVNLLGSIPAYNPNEEDLKVSSLAALLEDLKAKNKSVVDATTPLSNARIARNDILSKENTGLVDVALDVKSYVKSVFGATSPQFHQISGLEFKRYKG